MSEIEIEINEPISKFVQMPIFAVANESVKNAAKMMSDRNLGAVIVTLNDEPLGIVTEWDIISRVVAQGKDPSKTSVKEVMSAPVASVPPTMLAGEAIALMSKNKYRRLLVKDGDRILGVITLSQVVGHSRQNTITMPLLEPASGARCPYCGSILKDRKDLSRHIDSVHVREELLGGLHSVNP
jgi:CBS domain-containing protein